MERLLNYKFTQQDLPFHSIEDWENWEGKWELIAGVPFNLMPMPSYKHQKLSGILFKLFDDLLENCANCEVNLPINLKINKYTIIHPDIIVICNPEIENGLYLKNIPQLVIEILSPSTHLKDRNTKSKLYAELGIKYYILVEPEGEIVEVFLLKNKAYNLELKTHDEKFSFKIQECEIEFDFSKIW